jgi:hypothetical protein
LNAAAAPAVTGWDFFTGEAADFVFASPFFFACVYGAIESPLQKLNRWLEGQKIPASISRPGPLEQEVMKDAFKPRDR